MKKLFFAVLANLCLTACSGEKTLAVTHTVNAEYGDGETENFDRMDIFDRKSGKRLEA